MLPRDKDTPHNFLWSKWTEGALLRCETIKTAVKTTVDAFMDTCSPSDVNLMVEMTVCEKYRPQCLDRIKGQSDLDKSWETVASDVEGILQDCFETTRYNWDGIMLIGISLICWHGNNPFKHPMLPGLYIKMTGSCPENAWEISKVKIEQYLVVSGLELGLRMQHSDPRFPVMSTVSKFVYGIISRYAVPEHTRTRWQLGGGDRTRLCRHTLVLRRARHERRRRLAEVCTG